MKRPHWIESGKRSYKSKKALGILWDYMEEKLQTLLIKCCSGATPQLNPHITALIKKEEKRKKNLHDFDLILTRKKMLDAAKSYYQDFFTFLSDLEKKKPSQEVKKEKILAYTKDKREKYRCKLIENAYDGEDAKQLAAAVLYEQCAFLSRERAFKEEFKVRHKTEYYFFVLCYSCIF